MNDFHLLLSSPYKSIRLENVKSCLIESSNDVIEIFPEHTSINDSINTGFLYLYLHNEEFIFEDYNASINFSNDLNKLRIYCLDFAKDKEVILSFKDIQNQIKSDTQSKFYLKMLENNEIVLEKE
jgi:hypothetical protein